MAAPSPWIPGGLDGDLPRLVDGVFGQHDGPAALPAALARLMVDTTRLFGSRKSQSLVRTHSRKHGSRSLDIGVICLLEISNVKSSY